MNKFDAVIAREVKGSHEQGSEGWLEARMGRLTGSSMSKIVPMRMSSGRWTMPYKASSYIDEKIMEIVTGQVEVIADNEYMQWGRQCEPAARAWVEDIIEAPIKEVGAILMPWSDRVAISPDGVGVDSEGGLFIFESKSPKTKTHIGYLKANKVPADYVVQVQSEMMACEADYGYFCSYDPRAVGCEGLLLKVFPDEALQARIKEYSLKALDKIDKGVKDVKINSISINGYY